MANRELWIMNARIAFAPGVFEKKPPANDPKGKASYSCTLLLPINDPQVKKIEAIELELCNEHQWKSKEKGDAVHKRLAKSDKLALHDGEDKAAKYEGFDGTRFLNPSADARPTVMDGRSREPISKDDGVLYSGCIVNAKVELWVQDNNWGQRVNATLLGVQFVRDGDAFGAGAKPASPDDFPDLDVGADGGDEADPFA